MEKKENCLGHRIRKLRENRELTQRDLSQILGLTPKMISFYENNQRTPPVDILAKIAEIFQVSTDYLLGIDSTAQSSLVYKLNWETIKLAFPDACILIKEDSDLLDYYHNLSLKDKRWIMGQMIDRLERYEEDEKAKNIDKKKTSGL